MQELRATAERNGWAVVEEFVDRGISGAKGREHRPAFDRLWRGAARKDFDVVMVWAVDRLGRSLQHLVEFLSELHSKRIDLLVHQHDAWISGAAFTKDEQRILTWSGDGTARLWQAKDGTPLGRPMKHDKGILGATFTKDDQRILTWSVDGTARLWQAKDGAPIGQPMKHDAGIWGRPLRRTSNRS